MPDPDYDPFAVLRRPERTSSTTTTRNSATSNTQISRVKRKLTLTLDGTPNGNHAILGTIQMEVLKLIIKLRFIL